MEVLEIIWVDSCSSNLNWLLIENINEWKDVEPILVHTFVNIQQVINQVKQ